MKILFLVPYPTEGPSNRFRIEQYLPYLTEQGMEWTLSPFVSSAFYWILYQRGHTITKLMHFGMSCLRRLKDIIRLRKYDLVVVHREAFPIGPPWIERIIHRLNIPMVFDFDDSIFLPMTSGLNSRFDRFKRPGKIATIIKLSQEIIAGNEFLADFARQFNHRVTVIPSVIDTDIYRPLNHPHNKKEIVVGWIGSHSTRGYVDFLEPVFKALISRYKNVRFELVGTGYPIAGIDRMTARVWQLDKELADVQGFDIGIMPMPDNIWSQGKCGFKAILYQACGIPVVCSPVGVNREIVLDEITGHLASTQDEWILKLSLLIEDASRQMMGKNGRQHITDYYSVTAHRERFVEVLQRAANA